MLTTNLGVVIILITIFGYFSNWLNWQFLNYRITHLSYYIGTLIHETSHAVFCILTGAKIHEFKPFSSKPHVTYSKSRIPFVGTLLINIAPVIGGLSFLFLMNEYVLIDRFALPQYSDWKDIANGAWMLLSQVDLREWEGWALIVLFLNAGAMLGPSFQDLKNIWPLLLVLFFVQFPFIANLGLLAVSLIVVNIMIQVIAIAVIMAIQVAARAFRS